MTDSGTMLGGREAGMKGASESVYEAEAWRGGAKKIDCELRD